ncbi:putative cleavage and polyadenylation specificity factor subunit 2 [Babesia sp. Xinjiang]|uniref:putative cleavage and polyadenylation specificity factor subunit 2 n=1 Tax=Babesia sp. Xinjiang TaxID=462227 RepID=UPI000A24EC63|nr:putative cleavage and polyadenylation specificity factor subunit 2 [Babesia sp. Xinjiang]ORM41866.1 putative cleavage and polyadenylation specificity factor subunit 2 [Babesia sp. Xinjiang]
MASLLVEPLICGSLLATKLTLRIPFSILENEGSRRGGRGLKIEDFEPPSIGASIRSSLRSCRRSSNAADQKNNKGGLVMIDSSSDDDFGELNILINCGWSLEFEQESIELLKAHANNVDVIILTDGDFQHVGALPVIFAWLRDQRGNDEVPRILCTEGCYKFARACLVDVLENAAFSYKFYEYTLADLEYFYDGCSKLRYHESYRYTKLGEGWRAQISLTPLNNGVSIGGAVWKLEIGARTVVCGPTYRAQAAWYLDCCDVNSLRRPDVFITHDQPPLWDKSKKLLPLECNSMDSILSAIGATLCSQGSVLIPVDVSSHLLDLLLHLNSVWANSNLSQYPIVLVSPIAAQLVLLFATCIEYLRSSLCHSFLRTLWNPVFNMDFIHPISSMDELRKYTNMPCVYISTSSSTNFGVSSYLFAALGCSNRNTVIFTNETAEVRNLLQRYQEFTWRNTERGLDHEFNLRLNLVSPEGSGDTEMESPDDVEFVSNEPEASGGDESAAPLDEEVRTDFLFKDSHYFTVHNGLGTYLPAPIIRDDVESSGRPNDGNMDYGLSYTSMSAAELDPNLLSPGAIPVFGDPSPNALAPDVSIPPMRIPPTSFGFNPLNEYYTDHLGKYEPAPIIFEDESATSREEKSSSETSRLFHKRIPLVIKSGLYVTRYLQHHHAQSELVSFIRDICPSSIVLLPRTDDIGDLVDIERCVRDSVPGCGTIYRYSEELCKLHKLGNRPGKVHPRISIPLDLRQELVNRSKMFYCASQQLLDLARGPTLMPPKSLRQHPRIERIMTVLASIDRWKRVHNPRRAYQAIVRFEMDQGTRVSESASMLRCLSFWSDRPSRIPDFVLSVTGERHLNEVDGDIGDGMDLDSADSNASSSGDAAPTDSVIGHSLDHSLYTGDVGMPELVNYLESCIPNSCSVDRGVLRINSNTNDTADVAESLFKLRECLGEYRTEVHRLGSRLNDLERENDTLRHLCVSIGGIWDVLNDDLDATFKSHPVSSDGPGDVVSDEFLKLILRTRLPYSITLLKDPGSESPKVTIDSESIATSLSCKSQSQFHATKNLVTVDNPQTFLVSHVEAFNRRKDALVQRIQQSLARPVRAVVDSESLEKEGTDTDRLSCEQGKRQILEFAVIRLCDTVKELSDRVKTYRAECGGLKIEVSRLLKLNASLRQSFSNNSLDISNVYSASSKDYYSFDGTSTGSRTITEENSPANSVRSVEDVTIEFIIGSSLYSRLYKLCQSQDDAISRLERENAALRKRAEEVALDGDRKLYEDLRQLEAIQTEFIQRIDEYERRLDSCAQQLSQHRDMQKSLEELIIAVRGERDVALSELQSRDKLVSERLRKMAEVIKTFSPCEGNSSPDPALKDYKAQLQDLSFELEEISGAYEEKVKQTESLQQRVQELSAYRAKCATLEVELRGMEDKVSRAMSFCDRKVAASYQHKDDMLRRLEAYRSNWVSSYSRALFFEKKRDMAASALCETQCRLRECQREHEQLQSRVTHLEGLLSHGTATTSTDQTVSPGGEMDSIMRENDALRRRMTCTVCSEHFRDRCLTKCGHVFCEPCISSFFKSRNRKCPVCKVGFDRNDVRRIYLE